MSEFVIPESELIINNDGSIFHLHLRPEDISDKLSLAVSFILLLVPTRESVLRPFRTVLGVIISRS